MQTTLNLDGAQLTVPTEELFRSWMRERVAVQAIPGSVPVLQRPHLDDGEVYVGAFASADGSYLHHTVLLPFDRDVAPWSEQMDWAKSVGGTLPNRLELLMLWMTMRDRFQTGAYWACDVHHEDSAYAWCQYFDYGLQLSSPKGAALRAVAVRRSPIQPFTHS